MAGTKQEREREKLALNNEEWEIPGFGSLKASVPKGSKTPLLLIQFVPSHVPVAVTWLLYITTFSMRS